MRSDAGPSTASMRPASMRPDSIGTWPGSEPCGAEGPAFLDNITAMLQSRATAPGLSVYRLHLSMRGGGVTGRSAGGLGAGKPMNHRGDEALGAAKPGPTDATQPGGRNAPRPSPLMPDVGVIALVPDPWTGIWQSRHYILTRLARFFHVVWS